MRTKNKKLSAATLGFTMLLAACSGEGQVPDALAFQDSSSDPAPAFVPRPEGNLCAGSDHSIQFDTDVVLIDPQTTTLGPFNISLPAGTYDVTLATWLGGEELPLQTMEQWSISTDTGYTSPLTTDSSPVLVDSQTFTDQVIGNTAWITVDHKAPGMDSANSVHPLCVGFTSVEEPVVTTTTEAPVVTTTTEAPVVTTTEAPVVTTTEAPVVTTTEAPVVVEETTTTTEAPVVVEETTTTVAAPATTAAPTTTVAATAAPELALTGPSELALSLGLTGGALVLAGSAAVIASRRNEDD